MSLSNPKQVHLLLDEFVLNELKREAKRRDISIAEMSRRCISAELRRMRRAKSTQVESNESCVSE